MLHNPKKIDVLTSAISIFSSHMKDWDHQTLVAIARSFSTILLTPNPNPQTLVALRKLFNNNAEFAVKLMDNCYLQVMILLM